MITIRPDRALANRSASSFKKAGMCPSFAKGSAKPNIPPMIGRSPSMNLLNFFIRAVSVAPGYSLGIRSLVEKVDVKNHPFMAEET